MRLFPRFTLLLGIALALAPFFLVGLAPGCGGVDNITCDDVYDPNRVGTDGRLDPCCERSPMPCTCAPGYGDCKDAAAPTDAGGDADGGPHEDAQADPDAMTDADTGPPACPWDCLTLPPSGWFGPVLFQKGNVGDTIACPAIAPVVDFEGFADLVDVGPASCGACTCGPSTGTCSPPEHLTANTDICAGTAGTPTSFDPPPAWDGSCSTMNAVGPGSKSLTSGPLAVTESCTTFLGEPSVPTTPAAFGSSITACLGAVSECDLGHVCAPRDPAFRSCIWQPGDVPTCPEGYPVRIAGAEGLDDQRACSSCGCGDAEGGHCTGLLTVYKDAACTDTSGALALDSMSAPCVDVLGAGAVGLGSKTLTNVKYAAGTCAPSGGEPTGSVVPTGAATFCCLPTGEPTR